MNPESKEISSLAGKIDKLAVERIIWLNLNRFVGDKFIFNGPLNLRIPCICG